MSLPVRECGLKSSIGRLYRHSHRVTPCAGVWIEISLLELVVFALLVTPCAGVWIEIAYQSPEWRCFWSLPVRECGLKWVLKIWNEDKTDCHSLCGSVD